MPSIDDLRAAQEYIGERSGAKDSARRLITTAIQEVETKLADVLRRLDDNRALLAAVRRGNQRLQPATDTQARGAMVLGRISLYMENLPEVPDVSEQQARLVALREQETKLEAAVSTNTIQAKLESCLSNVNKHLFNYAQKIDLEYSDSPLRLDPRGLTVVADTPERPTTLRERSAAARTTWAITSSRTWLCTLCWRAVTARFLPSRYWISSPKLIFSPDTVPGDGVTQEKIDVDRRAVKRLFLA